ncbi:metallophosphoesterase [Parafrankia sp. EUN1f]|uniref:metallophosphoesterase family protein n=1 Tax=Parafrankia sp. EUN1f TaxID=102897 RepID=UPI0001C45F20|nr:metallophosphoesterase [Parafrankia sp. EUN1f]EFC81743.1 metallophosphoesterase [Parafrankia sp. EUN1f]
MRVAAVGDLHVVPGSAHRLRPLYQRAAMVADLLLLAGDLTNAGDLESAAELCSVVTGLDLPVVAVLGNHDHDAGAGGQVAAMLGDAGAIVLEGTAATIETSSGAVGVAGVTGFSDGQDAGRAATDGTAAHRLRDALASLDTDVRIALTHYAPVMETLTGEAPEIHRFLGSLLLGAAIDGSRAGTAPPAPAAAPAVDAAADPGPLDAGDLIGMAAAEPTTTLAVHGHAHHGQEMGWTPGGTPVRNVARPVIVAPFAVYRLPDGARIG